MKTPFLKAPKHIQRDFPKFPNIYREILNEEISDLWTNFNFDDTATTRTSTPTRPKPP